MTKFYAVFDTAGLPLGFYPDDVFPPAVIYGPTPEASADDPEPVAPVIGAGRNEAIPAGAVEISEAQWTDFIHAAGLRRWDASTSTVAAFTPPPVPAVIPDQVSKLGLVRALREKGDWARVKAALAADGDLQDDWDAAQAISRVDPLTQAVIATMGYSTADVDALMLKAETLAT